MEAHPDLSIMKPQWPSLGDEECMEIRALFRQLVADGNLKLIVNLEEIQNLSSRALGTLIEMHMHYVNFGGQMILANLDRRVEDLFVLTGLMNVFKIGPTMARARAQCQ